MDLYILRHGIAEETSASGLDRDRELTAEGREKSRRAGMALKKLGVKFDLVLSSPYPRAWETARLVAEEVTGGKHLHKCEALASGQARADAIAELRKTARTHSSVLAVGHEPDLSQIVSLLLSGSPRLSIHMRKGAICKLSIGAFDLGAATLEWFLTSKQLEHIA
jgi:phosphohistidine phosphatase